MKNQDKEDLIVSIFVISLVVIGVIMSIPRTQECKAMYERMMEGAPINPIDPNPERYLKYYPEFEEFKDKCGHIYDFVYYMDDSDLPIFVDDNKFGRYSI